MGNSREREKVALPEVQAKRTRLLMRAALVTLTSAKRLDPFTTEILGLFKDISGSFLYAPLASVLNSHCSFSMISFLMEHVIILLRNLLHTIYSENVFPSSSPSQILLHSHLLSPLLLSFSLVRKQTGRQNTKQNPKEETK